MRTVHNYLRSVFLCLCDSYWPVRLNLQTKTPLIWLRIIQVNSACRFSILDGCYWASLSLRNLQSLTSVLCVPCRKKHKKKVKVSLGWDKKDQRRIYGPQKRHFKQETTKVNWIQWYLFYWKLLFRYKICELLSPSIFSYILLIKYFRNY